MKQYDQKLDDASKTLISYFSSNNIVHSPMTMAIKET